MSYIDLTLKCLDPEQDETEFCNLEEALGRKDKLIVLLGAPGSGKSTLLQKYHDNLKNESQLFTIKKFLRLLPKLKSDTRFIFLDGLDEYRSTCSDKDFVTTKLGNRICQFAGASTIVISCREMDWYGETDVAALKDEVNQEVALYAIQALDTIQQRELATLFGIKDIDTFISKFSPLGLLDNPQMFFMLSEIYNDTSEKITTKTDLYLTFIENAREKNPIYINNQVNVLETGEILKYAGYLAFFYMFADVEMFDAKLIDRVCDAEKGYPKDKLKIVIKTSLFSKEKFIHRTIVEFLLAHYLMKYKFGGRFSPGVSLSRIKSIFVKNDRIPTELRGTYAWICSLTRNPDFIAVDPYYQAIHGDNSLFDSELKKQVVLEVKNYSQTKNPYFYKSEKSMQMNDFYDSILDDFFKSEFNSAIEIDNNYVYFLCDIFSFASSISHSMKEFIKEVILNPKIPVYYKRYLLDVFNDEPDFLLETLDFIKYKKIEDDENYLLDSLLGRLYPKTVTPDNVAEYLKLYCSSVGGFCSYLFKTKYEDKYKLVDEIHKNSFYSEEKPSLKLPENTEMFINDYFLETLLKFEDGLTANEIFEIINNFRQYYESYDKLEFKSYRYEITDKIPSCEEKLQKLTDEIFAIYIDNILGLESPKTPHLSFDYFHHYFYGYKTPANIKEIFLSRINSDRDPEVNKSLFLNALAFFSKEEVDCEEVWGIAKSYNLETELNIFLNPIKQQWQIEREERRKKETEKEQKILDDNEKYFASRTDEDILVTFSDLYFINNLVYFDRNYKDENEQQPSYLKPETFRRLKKLLKQTIFTESLIDHDLLCLESLAKESPDARRKIDRMYYSSCCLNEWKVVQFKDNDFFRYLFINVLMQEKMSGIIKSNLVEQVILKNLDLACAIMQEYIELIFNEYITDNTPLFLKYFKKETDIKKLKLILRFFYSDDKKIQDELLTGFLQVYNFSISIDDLKLLKRIVSTEKNQQTISALETIASKNKSAFNVSMAIAVHSLLFFDFNSKHFAELDTDLKILLIDYMLSQFNTPESIKFRDDTQSSKDSCAGFLRSSALSLLNLNELKILQEIRKTENDLWNYRITHKISEKEQADVDNQYSSFNVEKIKNFIISNDISSSEDFYADICDKLNKLKIEIEDNRNNEKDQFHNQDGTPKLEEACRDVVHIRLQDKYGYDLNITKEKYEANNRADLNIKYASNNNFEIQIECKRDKNPEINTGIPNQLIERYFSSGVQYGIYLIFYFGVKKDKNAMLEKVNGSIPDGYRNKIKVICIDLD